MIESHLTDQQVEAYRRRAVDAGERGEFDRHLAACDVCLRRVIDTTHSHVAFTALTEALLPATDDEPFHLSREELKKYAEGALDKADRVIFESHLEDCVECGSNARELVLISPVGATQQSERARRAPKTLWERLPGWPLPSLRPAQVGAIALACVCVLLGTVWIFSGRRNQSAPPQIAGNTQTQNQSVTPPEDSRNQTDAQQEPLQTEPEIVVSLVDGSRKVTLDERGNLNGLEGLDPSIRREVITTLSGEEMKKPDSLDALTAPRITLLDQSSNVLPFRLNSPVGMIVAHDRPTLSWQPLRGATNYTVAIFDSNFNRVMRSDPQTATRWSPPVPLQRGKVYFWEVTALKDNQEITSPAAPAPRAQFKILEAERVGEIERVKRARPDSHLVLGILYARAGLLTDAEREFKRLADANPRSQVAVKLLRRVRSWKKR